MSKTQLSNSFWVSRHLGNSWLFISRHLYCFSNWSLQEDLSALRLQGGKGGGGTQTTAVSPQHQVIMCQQNRCPGTCRPVSVAREWLGCGGRAPAPKQQSGNSGGQGVGKVGVSQFTGALRDSRALDHAFLGVATIRGLAFGVPVRAERVVREDDAGAYEVHAREMGTSADWDQAAVAVGLNLTRLRARETSSTLLHPP